MTDSGTCGDDTDRITPSTRELMESFLSRLDMVEWDRFVVGEDYHEEKYINVYGWIERTEDEYKDFVLLRFWPNLDEDGILGFTTSSDRHTQEIFRRLFDCEPDDHNDCRRVEHTFDVENAIELGEQTTLVSDGSGRNDRSVDKGTDRGERE